MLITIEQHDIYFDQNMHHSAINDQFALHSFLLAPYTDQSTFTTCRAHYPQLIICLFSNEAMFVAIGIQVVTCAGRRRVAFYRCEEGQAKKKNRFVSANMLKSKRVGR